MSTQSMRWETEKQSGTALLMAVALGTLFSFALAFLNAVKSGGVLREGNLLFGTLILYAAAAALYIGFGVSGLNRYLRVASALAIAGWAMSTLAAAHRWYLAGHAPFANIYEMLLSFVWTLGLLTQLAERRYGVKLIGSITMPIAVGSLLLMQWLPSDVRPLVPALQSSWLHVHVSLAMLAYAAFALSFALALMFLIKDRLPTASFLAATSAFCTAVYIAILATRFTHGGGLSVIAWDDDRKRELLMENGARLFVTVPGLGWIVMLACAAAVLPLVIHTVARLCRRPNWLRIGNGATVASLAVQVAVLCAFVLRVSSGLYSSALASDVYPTGVAASPFILSGMVGGIFATVLSVMLCSRRDALERLLPSAADLDRLTYKTVAIAFPLLTLMIAAGAYWANRAWGSYWSWDPKETWALITWLVYAGYLHMRITRGWRGRRAAYFAIAGFAMVMFTFFGVTYLLPGFHAYV